MASGSWIDEKHIVSGSGIYVGLKLIITDAYVHLRLSFVNINELLVQWWESERPILVGTWEAQECHVFKYFERRPSLLRHA